MSEPEEVIALKAQNELLMAQLAEKHDYGIALKAQNELLIAQLTEKEAVLLAATVDATELRKDLTHFKTLAKALEIQLCGRGTIDHRGEEVIPIWLRNSTLKRAQQWHVAIHFNLTVEAALLHKELNRIGLSLENFVAKLDRMYDRWGQDYHQRQLDNPIDEPQWEVLFDELKVSDRLERKSLRALLSCGKVAESANVPEGRTESMGYIIVDNIAYKAKNIPIKNFLISKGMTVQDLIHLMTEP